jgi:hypothetical protein
MSNAFEPGYDREMATRWLVCALTLAACSAPASEPLIGAWQEQPRFSTSIYTQRVFKPDGDFEATLVVKDKPPQRFTGRFVVRREANGLVLETCTDGVRCKHGGLWTREQVKVSTDRMTSVSPRGGPSTDWKRVTPAP